MKVRNFSKNIWMGVLILNVLLIANLNCVKNYANGNVSEKNEKKLMRSNKNEDNSDENLTKNKILKIDENKLESVYFASWLLFIPLVLLIFIMTILSIAGFLILIFNSNQNTSQNNPISSINSQNLSNNELLEILHYKQIIKRRLKPKPPKNQNYRPEPEPEGITITN